jgi:hypothetical protein
VLPLHRAGSGVVAKPPHRDTHFSDSWWAVPGARCPDDIYDPDTKQVKKLAGINATQYSRYKTKLTETIIAIIHYFENSRERTRGL